MTKFLSYVLRHGPQDYGVVLDAGGWVDVNVLLEGLAAHGRGMTREELDQIVATDEKQRYAIVDGRIRANQGHSITVDLGLEPSEPPEYLFHGTYWKAAMMIMTHGIRKMDRQYAHLSEDVETAGAVAARRGGMGQVLRVEAQRMRGAGYIFLKSANGVWLTDYVPVMFLKLVPN